MLSISQVVIEACLVSLEADWETPVGACVPGNHVALSHLHVAAQDPVQGREIPFQLAFRDRDTEASLAISE